MSAVAFFSRWGATKGTPRAAASSSACRREAPGDGTNMRTSRDPRRSMTALKRRSYTELVFGEHSRWLLRLDEGVADLRENLPGREPGPIGPRAAEEHLPAIVRLVEMWHSGMEPWRNDHSHGVLEQLLVPVEFAHSQKFSAKAAHLAREEVVRVDDDDSGPEVKPSQDLGRKQVLLVVAEAE